MIHCFDIDGTLCTNTNGGYEKAQPFYDVIAQVNRIYDEGHRVILYTARGSTTGIDWHKLTLEQLEKWGVHYHELVMGKPTADIYIDDKAINTLDWGKMPKQKTSEPSVFKKPAYLDTTYSPEHVPYGEYPYLLAQWLLKNVYKKPGRLLDLGCGRGEHLAAFAQLGFDVTGIDISPQSPSLAAGYCVKVADLEQEPLPFAENSFDFIFSKSVVEHMHHPTALLSKALESLRPNGIAVIMTPSWAHTHWGPFYIDHTHVTPFTLPSLADALTITGFESVTSSYFYQLPFLWHYPYLKPVVRFIAALPIPYRPYQSAPWSDKVNKLIRFSKEVMLLGIGKKPNGTPR